MDCLSTERMLEVINQDDASIDTTEFENHLSNCRECSERFEALMRDASKSRPLSAPHSAPQTVMLDSINRDLQCVVCGHDKFYSRKAQLNTAFLTFSIWIGLTDPRIATYARSVDTFIGFCDNNGQNLDRLDSQDEHDFKIYPEYLSILKILIQTVFDYYYVFVFFVRN